MAPFQQQQARQSRCVRDAMQPNFVVLMSPTYLSALGAEPPTVMHRRMRQLHPAPAAVESKGPILVGITAPLQS